MLAGWATTSHLEGGRSIQLSYRRVQRPDETAEHIIKILYPFAPRFVNACFAAARIRDVGLSNILDSDLGGRHPAEGSHG